MTRLLTSLRRFFRRETGTASIEVALMFPVVIVPFMMGMESGFMQLRRVMFERAVDLTVRDLRLGEPGLNTAADLKSAVCDSVVVFPKCDSDIMLEMTVVDVADFNAPSGRTSCVDRSLAVQPTLTYNRGTQNEMVMLRFCILHDPILPGTGVGAMLIEENGVAQIYTTTFYVNEPS